MFVFCTPLQNSGANDDAQRDLEQLTMAVFVIWKEEGGLQEPPEDSGIVIEGMEVLYELTLVASACALLLGLKKKMSPKVHNLYRHISFPFVGKGCI